MTGTRDATSVSVVFLPPSLATPPIPLGSVWIRPECQSNACATTTHLLAHFVRQSQSDWLKLWFLYSIALQLRKTPVVYLSSSFRRKKGVQVNGSQQCSLCGPQCFFLNQVAVQKHCDCQHSRQQATAQRFLQLVTLRYAVDRRETPCESSSLNLVATRCFGSQWLRSCPSFFQVLWNGLDHETVLLDIPTKLYVKFLCRPINFPQIFSWWAGCIRTLLVGWS